MIGAANIYHRIKAVFRHFIGGLWRRQDEHHILLAASGLSFSVIICIIPFLLVIFSVVGMLLARPTIAGEIDAIIGRMIPYPEYADQVRQFIADRVEEFWVYRKIAGWVGSIGLLFAASGLFSSMRTVLDTVFSTRSTRSAVLSKLHDLGLVVLVLLFFVILTGALPALGLARLSDDSAFLKKLNLGYIEGAAFLVVSFVIVGLAFAAIYFAVPHRRPPLRVIFVSALTATIAWHLAEWAFGYYIHRFVTFKQIYGTYSFLLVAALWLYYSSIVFIIGAEMGRLYDEWRGLKFIPPTQSASKVSHS